MDHFPIHFSRLDFLLDQRIFSADLLFFFANAARQRRKLFRQQRGCKVGVFPTPFHRPQSFPFGQQSVCPSTFVHLICGAIKFEAQHSDAIFTILIQFVENSHANGLCTYICGCGRMTPKETLAAIFEH